VSYRGWMRRPRPFDGPAMVDRASERRSRVDLDAAGGLVVSNGAVLMEEDRLIIVPASGRPAGFSTSFLGSVDGEDLVVVGVDPGYSPESPARMVPLREALIALSRDDRRSRDLELAIMAVAMGEWHVRHAYCSRCGGSTEPGDGGWVRRCPHGHETYPRTDPAVIVAITDEHDRILLAHVEYHSPGRYSHLAGYVEPGESFEQAAFREIREEASLRLEGLEYAGSQPWPFPASIMVAFRAKAASADLEVDGVEVTDAMWVTRDELRERLEDGAVRLASPGTIARTLIHDWYGGDPVGDAGVVRA